MSAFDTQVGGGHYKDMPIQPAEFCQKNKIPFMESCVIKYLCRHRAKNGVQDIDKAAHFLQLLKETEYGGEPMTAGIRESDPRKENERLQRAVEELVAENERLAARVGELESQRLTSYDNRISHLIACVGEEAGEIAQLVGKIQRFGMFDAHPKTGSVPNIQLLEKEINDLLGVVKMLNAEGVPLQEVGDQYALDRKACRVWEFMQYAQEHGADLGV